MEHQVNQREYRSILTLEPSKNDQYIVEGYAAKWEPYLLYEDGDGPIYERIDKGSFIGADMKDVIMQYDHRGKVFARMSNQTLELKIDNIGLFIRADLSKSQSARDLYEEIKAGLITKMSWGFTIKEWSYDESTRTFSVLKLKKVFDVSAVSMPANEDTEINARTFVINGVIEQKRQELLVRKRKELEFLSKL